MGNDRTEMCDACDGSGFDRTGDAYCGKCGGAGGYPTTPTPSGIVTDEDEGLVANLAEHLSACLGSIPADELGRRLAYSLERCGLALTATDERKRVGELEAVLRKVRNIAVDAQDWNRRIKIMANHNDLARIIQLADAPLSKPPSDGASHDQ